MSFVNHLSDIVSLRNNYYGVRHGESEANVAHLISSNPQVGTQSHGLTSYGRTQVAQNVELFLQNHPVHGPYMIVSSDFRRARETADILALSLSFSNNQQQQQHVQLDKRLRERFFGIFDGTTDANYEHIWAMDEENQAKNQIDQVESVESVRDRTTLLIKELEANNQNTTIFLVAHGDSLQILQTAFERMSNASRQRYLRHWERAEFRPLILKNQS